MARQSIPLFAYRCGNSPVHKLSAIFKLILLFIISIRTFSSSFQGKLYTAFDSILWFRTAFYFIVTLIFFITAGTSPKRLKSLMFVPVMGLLVTIFRVIGMPNAEIENQIVLLPFLALNINEIPEGILYIARFFVTSCAALVMFETTSRIEIQDAFCKIENAVAKIIPPIKKINFPVLISATIAFIPEIFSTWNKIKMASSARTPNIKSVSYKRRLEIIAAELTALLSCMISKAEETRKAIVSRSNFN